MAKKNKIISVMADPSADDAVHETVQETVQDAVQETAPQSAPARRKTKPQAPDRRKGPAGPGPRPGTTAPEERVLAPGERPPDPPPPPPGAVPLAPVAAPAHMKRRHWGQVLSFLLFVLVPMALIVSYLYEIAEDQYASTTGFTVQREEGGSATDLLGGVLGFGSSSGASDTDVLYEFIQSQELVRRIDAKLDLRGHYSQHWDGEIWETDKVFSIWPDAAIEDLQWFWRRVVRIAYDASSGLMEIKVLAFDAQFARDVAREIVAESQAMINDLSEAARADATRYAEADLEEALQRLTVARQALTEFRTRTQIVDPLADLQTRLGVMNNLQQQLAQALIDYDLLRETTSSGDPRLVQEERKIVAIRERIRSEREAFSSGDATFGSVGEDYPTLIAEYERLSVDREYAEETYRAALTALEVARDNAARQSRYLATYIEPTLADRANHPQRLVIAGLAALFLVLAWSIVVLIYYSIRDRR